VLPVINHDVMAFVMSRWQEWGGFGGLPGTTSFIENTHCWLKALALMDSAPLSPDMARDFILRCKTRGGGFARKSGGAPFLYATWHAVASLNLLSDRVGLNKKRKGDRHLCLKAHCIRGSCRR